MDMYRSTDDRLSDLPVPAFAADLVNLYIVEQLVRAAEAIERGRVAAGDGAPPPPPAAPGSALPRPAGLASPRPEAASGEEG